MSRPKRLCAAAKEASDVCEGVRVSVTTGGSSADCRSATALLRSAACVGGDGINRGDGIKPLESGDVGCSSGGDGCLRLRPSETMISAPRASAAASAVCSPPGVPEASISEKLVGRRVGPQALRALIGALTTARRMFSTL